jgi:hypothetical protein
MSNWAMFLAITLADGTFVANLPVTGGGGGMDWVLPTIVAAVVVLVAGIFLARRNTPR